MKPQIIPAQPGWWVYSDSKPEKLFPVAAWTLPETGPLVPVFPLGGKFPRGIAEEGGWRVKYDPERTA